MFFFFGFCAWGLGLALNCCAQHSYIRRSFLASKKKKTRSVPFERQYLLEGAAVSLMAKEKGGVGHFLYWAPAPLLLDTFSSV
jgi:hypothetical protein